MYSVVWMILCSTVTGQVLDVDRMISKTALGHQQDLHPVIRTLYDHADVRCLHTCASLESRLSVPDFVSQLWRKIGFLQCCETKSGTESLDSRLYLCTVRIIDTVSSMNL